LQMKI